MTAPIWVTEWKGQTISYEGSSIVRPEAERLHNAAVIRVGLGGEDPEAVVRDLVGVWAETRGDVEPMTADAMR